MFRSVLNVYIFFNPIIYFKMKGEIAICASPKCNKQFIKKNKRQKCCGSSTCRAFYNRHKNGQSLYPSFINDTGFVSTSATEVINQTRTITPPQVNVSNVGNNISNSILNGAIVPAISSMIGGATFGQKVAGSVFSGAIVPLIKEFINSGNSIRFSSLDEEIIRLESDKKYWENQKSRAVNGVMPYKSLGGALIGGLLGYMLTDKTQDTSKAQRNALIGSILLGGAGTYMERRESQQLAMNAQNIIDNADRELFNIDQKIKNLRNEKAKIQKWVDDDILVEGPDGVYSVNNEVLNSIISADEYKTMQIPKIQFKGAYKYLLSEARQKFYKIVSGLPEQGKTSYCVKFATYYAANHGRVLYMPSEQSGDNLDFQKVITRMNGSGFDIDRNVNTYDFQQLLKKIKAYDLVILDSINNMKLNPQQVQEINKQAAIMAVMQSTKDGSFKGGQAYFHDCDKFVVIDKLAASVSKSRGTNPLEQRESIQIDKLK